MRRAAQRRPAGRARADRCRGDRCGRRTRRCRWRDVPSGRRRVLTARAVRRARPAARSAPARTARADDPGTPPRTPRTARQRWVRTLVHESAGTTGAWRRKRSVRRDGPWHQVEEGIHGQEGPGGRAVNSATRGRRSAEARQPRVPSKPAECPPRPCPFRAAPLDPTLPAWPYDIHGPCEETGDGHEGMRGVAGGTGSRASRLPPRISPRAWAPCSSLVPACSPRPCSTASWPAGRGRSPPGSPSTCLAISATCSSACSAGMSAISSRAELVQTGG